MRRRAHAHEVEDVAVIPYFTRADDAAIIGVPGAGMEQTEIMTHLMGAGFEVPLRVVQPRSASSYEGDAGRP